MGRAIMFIAGLLIMFGAIGYLESVPDATILGCTVKLIAGAILCAPFYRKELRGK